MKAVYLKELRSYFTSTLGYIYIAMMLVIFGFYFFLQQEVLLHLIRFQDLLQQNLMCF